MISGDITSMDIDIDFSSFHTSNTVMKHQRPQLNAMLKTASSYSNEHYEPDELKFDELVDYAYGEGSVYNSFWDTEHKPYMVMTKRNLIRNIDKKYFIDEVIHNEIVKVTPLEGAHGMKLSTHRVINFEIDGCENAIKHYMEHLRVGYRIDGGDVFILESEAFGVLLTLPYNFIVNYAMQRKLINKSKFRDVIIP